MPFIPNYADAGLDPNQAEPDSGDFEILLAGTRGDGVLSGCAVTGATTFLPTDIAGLLAWWDFSDAAYLYTDAGTTLVSADGDAIYQVSDKSGSGNHVTQSTLANRPLYKTAILNGHSVGRFDATDYMGRATFTGGLEAQPTTWFVVGKTTTTSAYAEFFDNGAGGSDRQAFYQDIGNTWNSYSDSTALTGPASDTSIHIFALIFNGGSGKIYVGGGTPTSGNAGTGSVAGVTIAAGSGPVSLLIGDIAAILIYNSGLSTTDLDQVGNYFNSLYGLTWSPAV